MHLTRIYPACPLSTKKSVSTQKHLPCTYVMLRVYPPTHQASNMLIKNERKRAERLNAQFITTWPTHISTTADCKKQEFWKEKDHMSTEVGYENTFSLLDSLTHSEVGRRKVVVWRRYRKTKVYISRRPIENKYVLHSKIWLQPVRSHIWACNSHLSLGVIICAGLLILRLCATGIYFLHTRRSWLWFVCHPDRREWKSCRRGCAGCRTWKQWAQIKSWNASKLQHSHNRLMTVWPDSITD